MNTPASGDGALLALPSRRVSARIVPWRRRYDPEHWRLIPPHVTVAYPFVRDDAWTHVREDFARVLDTFPPFWVTLAELGAFEQPQPVLWLRPDDGGMLTRIHAALVAQFPADVKDGPLPFVPHLTLGFFDTLAALEDARKTVATDWEPVRFRVKALAYMTMCEDGTWCTRDTLPLSGERQG